MTPVLVRGDGVAASCCVHLLGQAGIPVAFDRPSRPRLPAIMLSEAAISLIADVFAHKDLFRDLPRIRSRAVLWGSDAAVTLPHSAVVVSEQTLLDHIRPHTASAPLGEELAVEPAWQVFASRPLPPASVEERFGTRIARAWAVELRNGTGPGCWTESLDAGWLFLIASGDGAGWLLSVGGAADAVLGRSRLIAKQIERLGESGGEFPAFPRMIAPLCGRGGGTGPEVRPWLACGTAAMAFDPICGDGTAHAVREAILAAAVIRAISTGAPADEVFAHYESRLTAGFQRHLVNCMDFYRSGGDGPWWVAERNELERGVAWCASRMSQFPAFRYRLNGFELEAVA
jgi:hypothetical protein